MNKTKLVVDVLNNTSIVVDLTEEEILEIEANESAQAIKVAEAIAKKSAAEAKLAELGLTAEDLKALGI
jgi:hypothetical protein